MIFSLTGKTRDLEPFEYIAVYEDNIKLKKDWEVVLSFQPERIYYSHRPEKRKTQM